MTIETNIEASQASDEIMELALHIAGQVADAARFWEVLEKRVSEQTPSEKKAKSEPMSEVEAQAFESREFPFGSYQGYAVGDVDPHYTARLSDPSEVMDELRRYAKSMRFQNRLDFE